MGTNIMILLLVAASVTSTFAIKAIPMYNVSYAIVTSDVLIPGSEFVIDVHLLKLIRSERKTESEECILDLKVSSNGLFWYASNWKIDLEKDTSTSFMKSVRMMVPSDDRLLKDKHVIKVESNNCFQFSRSFEIPTARKDLLVSLTSEKLKYRPGDLVVFRTLVETYELNPYSKPVNLSVLNSRQVPLVKWLNVTSDKGMIIKAYRLPLFLKDDFITIVLEHHEQRVNHTIKIERPIGPYDKELFRVDVRVPKYLILPSSDESKGQSLEVNVVASQHSGVPLSGRVNVYLTLVNNTKRVSFPSVQLVAGHRVISLKPNEIKELLGLKLSDSLAGQKVQVEVKVEERRVFVDEKNNDGDYEGILDILLFGKDFEQQIDKDDDDNEHDDDDDEPKVYVTRKFVVNFVNQSHVLFFTEFTPLFFKPGLMYVGQVFLKQVEESVSVGEEKKKVNIVMNHFIKDSDAPAMETKSLYLTSNSVGSFMIKARPEDVRIELEATFEEEFGGIVKAELKNILPFTTFNDSRYFVQVLLLNKSPKVIVGEKLKSVIQTTFPIYCFTYKIFSQSLVVLSGKYSFNTPITSYEFSVDIPQNVSHLLSDARLVVATDSPSHEIIFDSFLFVVESRQPERPLEVEIPKQGEPGQDLEMTIRAEPYTEVYILFLQELLVTDPKELELRKQISHEKMLRYIRRVNASHISQYINGPCKTCFTIPSLAPDTFRVLNETGAIFLTDAGVSFNPSEPWPVPARKNVTLDDLEPSNLDTIEEFADDLRELNMMIGSTGEEVALLTMPEEPGLFTIVVFGTRPGRSLVVFEESLQFTSGSKVLASLKHPKSIVRGEEMVLEVHLFNNQEETVEIEIKVNENPGFQLVCLDREKVKEKSILTRTIKFTPKELKVVPIYIKSSATGQEPLTLEVLIVSKGFKKILESKVDIEYQGYEVSPSSNLFLDNFNGHQHIELDLPKNITNPIESSEHVVVKIYGHPLGPAIDHVCRRDYAIILDDITKLWYVQRVNILEHIANNSLFDDRLQIKYGEDFEIKGSFEVPIVKEECVTAVKESLEYVWSKRRNDGSYSCNISGPGYIWLTSMILDAQVQLKDVLPKDEGIWKTLRWLAEQQQCDGSFVEPQDVLLIREEVKGMNWVPLTSQVVISLLQTANNLDLPKDVHRRLNNVVKKSVEYLEAEVLQKGNHDKDAQSLTVVSYALVLVRSEKVSEVLLKRDRLVVSDGDEKYWKVEKPNSGEGRSLSIESTSYAIMTSLAMGDLEEARLYANHVIRQMKPDGGFVNTMDTNVALRALSRYYRHHDNYYQHRQVNAVVNVTLADETKVSVKVLSPLFVGSLYVDHSNLSLSGPLKFDTSGEGILVVQTRPNFNQATPTDKPVEFDLTIEVKHTSLDRLELKVCAVNLVKEPSLFLMGEVPLLTGYELNVEKTEANESIYVLKNKDEVLVIYSAVLPSSTTCVDLVLDRIFKVGRLETRYAKLFSFTEPSKQILKPYNGEEIKSGIKHVCLQCKC